MARSIMITGAAGGIGGRLVERAVERGDRVFAAARTIGQLSDFACAPAVTPIAMDVSDTESVASGFARIDNLLKGDPLNVAIHCAAVAPAGPMELTGAEELLATLNVNTVGTHRIVAEAIPRLRGHDGRIIVLSSLWGRTGGPLLSRYCASKHAIAGLIDSARRETRGQRVHISLIETGVVDTKMLGEQSDDFNQQLQRMSDEDRERYGAMMLGFRKLVAKSKSTALSTDAAARQIEKPLFKRRPAARYRVGKDASAIYLMSKFLPTRVMDRLMAAAF